MTKSFPIVSSCAALFGLAVTLALPAHAVDLLKRYPTTLTAGVLQPSQARPWEFTPQDVFRVSGFQFKVGDQLRVETGPSDLGIGHCADGAVWAILVPVQGGKLSRKGTVSPEDIAHIWLRFHPAEINDLFPPNTVSSASGTSAVTTMRRIANGKLRASYHAGMDAMIPEPKNMTVDLDTKAGPRRFFVVDARANTAKYINAFEGQPVHLGGPPTLVSSTPADGAKNVDPALKEITVTFDQDMSEGFSWTGSGPEHPQTPEGATAQWRGKRTCVLPVKLEPGHRYRVGINSPSYRNFRSVAGESADISSIHFNTKP